MNDLGWLTSRALTARLAMASLAVGIAGLACTPGVPGPTPTPTTPGTQPTGAATTAPPSPSATPATSLAATPTLSLPPASPSGTTGTTFRVEMADGPMPGTWEAVAPGGFVPACSYFPDRDSWTATLLGPPPLSFVDAGAANDRDPYFVVTLNADTPTEIGFTPEGEVTFNVDDRGDTATLTFSAAQGRARLGEGEFESLGAIDVSVECDAIFRYEP